MPIATKDQNELEAEAVRRGKAIADQYVRDPYAATQRKLWETIIGKKLLEILEFEDAHGGADILLHIFVPPTDRDMQLDKKYTVMAVIVDQGSVKIWFQEATYKGGHLIDPKGQNILHGLQSGNYTIM